MNRNSIFETKMNAVTEWSDHLLNTVPVDGEIKDICSRKNLELIFYNHPLKSRCIKPEKFIVTRHPIYNNKCFAAIGENMELFPFSIKNNAIKGNVNFRDILHKLCRRIVKDQVYFKKERMIQKIGLVCQKTGNTYPKKDLHLHHEPPYEFNIICDSFLKSKGAELDENLFKYNHLGELAFDNTDFKYEFLKYHARFLNDGHVSLVSSELNQKLGVSYKFKNIASAATNTIHIPVAGDHLTQYNLFSAMEV